MVYPPKAVARPALMSILRSSLSQALLGAVGFFVTILRWWL